MVYFICVQSLKQNLPDHDSWQIKAQSTNDKKLREC